MPFLWIIIISSWLCDNELLNNPYFLTMSGLITGLITVYLKKYPPSIFPSAHKITFIVTGICFFNLYILYKNPPAAERPWAPEREVNITLKITSFFNTSYPQYYGGIGIIINTPPHLQYLHNQATAFSTKSLSDLQIGDTGQLKGVLSTTFNRKNQTPFQHYLKSLQIHYQIKRGQWLTTLTHEPIPESWQTQLISKFNTFLTSKQSPPAINAVYKAMLLGDTQLLNSEYKRAFSLSGTLHLFAISGLHIGVIATFLFYILRYLRCPFFIKAFIGLSSLLVYVIATGATPSAQRAWIMIACLWIGTLFKRETTAANSLLAACILSLIYKPNLIYHAGFQLSYSVVAALILYGLPLSQFLKQQYTPWIDLPFKDRQHKIRQIIIKIWHYLLNASALSIAATLISLPLMVYYFETLSPIALPLNILIIPIASIVMIIGFISLLLNLLHLAFIANILNTLACKLLQCLTDIIDTALSIPHAYMHFKASADTLTPAFVIFLIFLWIYIPEKKQHTAHFFLIPWYLLFGNLIYNVFYV